MKCSNCGADLSNDTKFCSYCGEKVETDNFNSCDNNVSESGKEETSNQTTFSPEKEKKSIFDSIKDRGVDFWNKLSSYEKVTTIALTIFVLMCLIAFLAGKVFAGIIALLSIALTVVAVLMKKQIIKVPKSWLHIVALAIAIVLIVPYCSLFGGNTNSPTDEGEEFSWSNLILGEVIPQPESNIGEIILNTESSLSVCINRTSTDDFYDYINACKDKGFITDAEQLTSSYEAYNESGYKLYMYYTESDNEMQIDVDAPVKYGELKWSDSGLGKLLPTPVSKVGEINKDDDKGFKAVVAETPIEAFKDYIKQCTEKGFSVDEIESEKSYDAKNTDGYKLSVKYTGNNVMSISLEEPEYQVNIEVECTENLIFSKYDVDVYVDDSLAGTISHGATETYSVTLTKGTYTIKFVNAENDDVTGTVKIDVTKDEEYKFKISCSSSGIDVDTINGAAGDGGNEDDTTSTPNNTNSDAQKIKVTMSEDELKGLATADAEKKLKHMGFTIFEYDTLDAGDSSELDGKIGAVEIKSWAFGKGDFAKGDEYESDAIVVLWSYKYTEPEKPVENLTVDNCPELAAILSNKADIDESYSAFALKYEGRIIEFDGRIDYCTKHGNYNTRFDYLVSAGDYDPNSQIGPSFKFEDVNYYDLNTNLDTVSVGLNVRVVAEVVSFDRNSGLFYLEPVSVTSR